jgi:hypothetical protein
MAAVRRGRRSWRDAGVFGSGKTGSTWLSHMMADLDGYRLWAEPNVRKLFGASYERAREG